MRYGSVCSGIEAATVAWHPLGWEPAWFAEVEPFPCAVLKHHYPTVPNLGDISKITKRELRRHGRIDVLVGGTPCFPADTMIATGRGFVPIQDVNVGDSVLSHAGRFCRVAAVGSKRSPTVVVKGQGHCGLRTTADHPFLSREKSRRSTRVRGRPISIKSVSEPQWTPAREMAGKHWACVADWPRLPVPPVVAIGQEHPVTALPEDLFRLAGAYIGDGWVSISERRGVVRLGLNQQKLEILKATLDRIGNWSASEERTAVKVSIPSRPLARWLSDNFGSSAHAKAVPMWALGMDRAWRLALIEGYCITDGGSYEYGVRATTVSRQLALTMRALAVSCDLASSVGFCKRPDTCVIEGRIVNQSDTYTVSFSVSGRTSFYGGGHRWQRVRSVKPTGDDEVVYNIEVEGDHSYVADGIAVHNCQSFSVAGLRKGLADPRGNLALEFLRIADAARPTWLLWENVPGVLSSGGGRDFGSLLGGMAQLRYGWAYRVLDAQYFGVPQRRRRVFVVGHLGDRRRAAAVLFERHSLQGHPAPRRQSREDVAGTVASRTTGGGGLGTDFECSGGVVTAYGGNNTSGPIDVASACNAKGGSGRMDFESETFITAPLTTKPYADHQSTETRLVVGSLCANGKAAGSATQQDAETGKLLVTHALRGESYRAGEDGTGRGTPLVPVAFSCKDSGDDASETAPTLRAMNHGSSHANAGGQVAVAYQCHGSSVGPMGTIRAGNGTTTGGVPFVTAFAQNQRDEVRTMDVAGALSAEPGMKQQTYIQSAMAVRRLTPRECERLMGLPDGYTLVPYRGKPAADGPRYKAIGNSFAVPVVRWIGERIEETSPRP